MTKIFVGNLPHSATEAELRRRFEQYGPVASVDVMVDPVTHRPRGFAFVRMRRLDDADEAIHSLRGTMMGGRRLTVDEAKRPPQNRKHARAAGAGPDRDKALEFFDALCDDCTAAVSQK